MGTSLSKIEKVNFAYVFVIKKRRRFSRHQITNLALHPPPFLEAASLEAASIKAASLEAASIEAASLEAASLEAASLEAASIEAASREAAATRPPHARAGGRFDQHLKVVRWWGGGGGVLDE